MRVERKQSEMRNDRQFKSWRTRADGRFLHNLKEEATVDLSANETTTCLGRPVSGPLRTDTLINRRAYHTNRRPPCRVDTANLLAATLSSMTETAFPQRVFPGNELVVDPTQSSASRSTADKAKNAGIRS